MVADVRLDNRPELIADLGLGGRADNLCDAALLFKALQKWGSQAVQRLVGEFAFAFWNASRQELLLGRDCIGLRPLHYHRGKNFFAFASMPSGLHALPEVPYAVDTDFMIQALALAAPANGRSNFRGIERVEPAHLVTVSRQGLHAERHWNPRPPSGPALPPEEYEEGLRLVLDQAVAAQLRGSGSVIASHLSAGLDSSTVTATVARAHPGQVMAFTAVPPASFDGQTTLGTFSDEGGPAAAVAKLYPNIRHVLVENPAESPLRWLDRTFAYQQQPMRNIANAAWGQAINQAAKASGATTLFKGGLGNLTISYDGLEWLPFLASRGALGRAGRVSWELARRGVPLPTLGARLLAPFLPKAIWRAVRRATGRASELSSYSAVDRQRLRSVAPEAERLAEQRQRHGMDPFATRLRALSYGDAGGNGYKGALAEWGLSIRDPTTDRRVIEFCLAVPFEEFTRGGIPRSLARRAFSDRLPPEILNARKRGLQSANWHEAFDHARNEIIEELAVISRSPDAMAILDDSWISEAMQNWPSGGWNDDETYSRYRLGLLRGVSAGHFIRKVAGTN